MNDSTHPPALVIFDCDGTLVDSEVVAAQAWSEYVAGYGVALSAEEALARFRGVSMTWCLAHIEALHGQSLPQHFEQELRALMARLLEQQLQPINGALDMVEKLHLPFALASNAPHHKIELCLRVTGLLPHFAGRIFSAYDVQRWKPDPALFQFAAARMGVDAGRTGRAGGRHEGGRPAGAWRSPGHAGRRAGHHPSVATACPPGLRRFLRSRQFR